MTEFLRVGCCNFTVTVMMLSFLKFLRSNRKNTIFKPQLRKSATGLFNRSDLTLLVLLSLNRSRRFKSNKLVTAVLVKRLVNFDKFTVG